MVKDSETLQCDTQGRLYLKEGLRSRYGTVFMAIQAPDELVLIPVPKDPLKAFQQLGKAIPKGLKISEIKQRVRARALRDALSNVC